ncbi:MAG: hypothetical protein NC218_05370 [Acetobacter sp.]|nr:hypothetical protein [Acetobacter sp.]
MKQNTPNYYNIIEKHLKKQYPSSPKKENAALSREVIFAPKKYSTEVNGKKTEIATIRENLADFIERENSEKKFIPYSLDAQIADLIENTSCETSSMNEYYRWISATSEIVRNTTDGDVTEQDISERKDFLNMSYDRENEILLCLALYEAAGTENNKEKIEMLKFKLARLREMRSIVSNTTDRVNINKDRFHQYCNLCRELLGQEQKNFQNINLKLSDIIHHNDEEDLSDDFSFLDHLKMIILYMMRKLENISEQNQHTKTEREPKHDNTLSQQRLSSSRSENLLR